MGDTQTSAAAVAARDAMVEEGAQDRRRRARARHRAAPLRRPGRARLVRRDRLLRARLQRLRPHRPARAARSIRGLFRELGFAENLHFTQATGGRQLQFVRPCAHGDDDEGRPVHPGRPHRRVSRHVPDGPRARAEGPARPRRLHHPGERPAAHQAPGAQAGREGRPRRAHAAQGPRAGRRGGAGRDRPLVHRRQVRRQTGACTTTSSAASRAPRRCCRATRCPEDDGPASARDWRACAGRSKTRPSRGAGGGAPGSASAAPGTTTSRSRARSSRRPRPCSRLGPGSRVNDLGCTLHALPSEPEASDADVTEHTMSCDPLRLPVQ